MPIMVSSKLRLCGTNLATITVLVLSLMAVNAQGDKIFGGIASGHAARFTMMNLQVS
jgi:hypothetical protein